MACSIFRDKNTGKIKRVLAPNGKDSKLYSDIVSLLKENPDLATNDPYINKVLDEGQIKDSSPEELALAMWSKVYTEEFQNWFNPDSPQNTSNSPDIKSEYRGKIIYVNSGAGKSFSSSLSNRIVDADTVLASILNTNVKDLHPTLAQIEDKSKIYSKLKKLLQDYKDRGFTVVTPNVEMMDIADKAIIQPNPYVVQKSTQSKLRQNVYERSIVAHNSRINQIKYHIRRNNLNVVELESNQFLADEIFNDYRSSKSYKHYTSAVDSLLTQYLSHFGIEFREFNSLKSILPENDFAIIDTLEKLAVIDSNVTESIPQAAASFITFMMQYKPEYKAVAKALEKDYPNETKEGIRDIIETLVFAEITRVKGSKSDYITKIKKLIISFFNLFKSTPPAKRYVREWVRRALDQDTSLIDQFNKPGSRQKLGRLYLEEGLSKDDFGRRIVLDFSKRGYTLTGSISIAEQGTVLRPKDNPLHDVDFITDNKNRSDIVKDIKELGYLKKPVRVIRGDKYTTYTYLIHPQGTRIVNWKQRGRAGKILSYEIKDSYTDDIIGTYSYKNGRETYSGMTGKMVDFFAEDGKSGESFTVDTKYGEVRIPRWQNPFKVKLSYARDKDIWDYVKFTPKEEYRSKEYSYLPEYNPYELTNTESSVTVDENGEPKLFYHGTDIENITEFDKNRYNYFSDNLDLSKEFGKNIIPVFINSKNPLAYDYNFKSRKDFSKYANALSISELQNNDAVYLKNTLSINKSIAEENLYGNTMVVKKSRSNKVKSLFNAGQFSETTNNIYYQLEAPGVRSNKDIAAELAPVLDKYGIKLNSIQQYAEATGQEFNNAVVALADPIRKIIAIAEGKGDSTTLPEELAHIVIENEDLSGYEIGRALNYVTKTAEYLNNAEEYRQAYKADNPDISDAALEIKVKKEILGKLLGKHILKKIERKGDNALLRMLRRIWDNFLSLFKGRDISELENTLDRLSDEVLDINKSAIPEVKIRGSLYTESPTVEVMAGDKPAGTIKLDNKGKNVVVREVNITDLEVAKRAMTELGELAHANGLQLISDTRRTGMASRVWKDFNKSGKADKKGKKHYYIPVGLYYQLEEGTRELLDDFIVSLQNRIKSLRKRGVSPSRVREQKRTLSREAREGYAALGIVKFIRLLSEDSDDAISYIQEITKDARLYEYFTSPNTSPERLKQLRKEIKGNKITARKVSQLHEFVNYYKPYLQDLEAYIGMKEKSLSDLKRRGVLKAIRTELEKFRQIEKFKDNVREQIAEDTYRKYYAAELNLDPNDPDIDQAITDKVGFDWKSELVNFSKDSPMLEYWFGSLRDASDQILRLVHAIVTRVKQAVRQSTIDFGQEMLRKAEELGVAYQSFDWAYEKQVGKEEYIAYKIKQLGLEGKEAEDYREKQMKSLPDDVSYYTGYFISPWQASKFDAAKQAFHKQLHEKYGFPEDFEERLDLKDQIRTWAKNKSDLNEYQLSMVKKFEDYNKEIAEWYFANTQPIDNINEAINERKRILTKKEFKEWKAKSIGRSYDKWGKPFNYYKGDLVRPATGRTRINPYDQSKVKTADYTNKDWNKLDENQKKFLKWILQKKFEMDNGLPASTHATKAPQITESFLDIIHSQKGDMFRRIGINIKEAFEIQDEDYLQGEEPDRRPDGSIVRYVPIRFTHMKDTDLISTDLISSMVAYYEMSENFKRMTEKLPEIDVIQQQLAARTLQTRKGAKRGSETATYRALDKFLDMNISEMRKADLEWMGVNWTAALQKLGQYVRTNNLAWNIATQFTNMISSTGLSYVEDVVGQYTNLKSKAWAHKESWNNIRVLMKDVMNPTSDNKMYMLMQHIGISDDLRSLFDNLDKAKATKMLSDAGMYKGYQLGDFVVKSKVMLAAMHNYRKYKGKFYTKKEFDQLNVDTDFYSLPSSYDLFTVENGKLRTELSEDVKNKLFSRIEYIANQVDGKLAPTDYAAVHQHAVFSLVAIHRNWLFGGIQKRFRKRGFNFMTGQVEEGHYNVPLRKAGSLFRMIKSMYFNEATTDDLRTMLTNGYENLDDIEKIAIKRVLTEMAFAALAVGVAVLLNKLADDDEDNYIMELSAYLGNRVAIEASSFYNPQEFITVIKDPFVPLRLIEYSFDFVDILDGEEIERGAWEGWSRRERFFARLFPGVKGMQTLADPSGPNQFLKNKPLKQLYNLVED